MSADVRRAPIPPKGITLTSSLQPLSGLRVVEGASYVAAPSAGLALAQLGADVIRVDPPKGGSDFLRWPLSSTGDSLFWTGLNKGKRSVTIDYRRDQGRELLLALATAPGDGAGIFLDNMVGRQRPTYEELRARREDVIHVHLQGRSDGSPAVDYTINAEVGVPQMTGPQGAGQPVNHVLPAWDLLSGMVAASGILAAVLHRERVGQGANLELALADVAVAGVGSMGWLAEAELRGSPRVRHGNHMYGSFGVDFETSDGRRLMVVALTEGQWRALREVTETGAVFAALEQVLGADLNKESDRYQLRETIAAVLKPWFAQRTSTLCVNCWTGQESCGVRTWTWSRRLAPHAPTRCRWPRKWNNLASGLCWPPADRSGGTEAARLPFRRHVSANTPGPCSPTFSASQARRSAACTMRVSSTRAATGAGNGRQSEPALHRLSRVGNRKSSALHGRRSPDGCGPARPQRVRRDVCDGSCLTSACPPSRESENPPPFADRHQVSCRNP